MNRMKRSLLAAALAGVVALSPVAYTADQAPVMTVYAHGHHSSHHSSSSGTNYYYCNGHAAHTHANGVCPYSGSDTSCGYCNGHVVNAHHNGVCPYSSISSSTVKKTQKRLNRCGYSCGTADGVIGSKTIKAIKNFQKDHGLTVDGIIGKKTLKAIKAAAA